MAFPGGNIIPPGTGGAGQVYIARIADCHIVASIIIASTNAITPIQVLSVNIRTHQNDNPYDKLFTHKSG
jgi:hypothetical protein